MKTSGRFLLAMEVLIKLAAMAVLARVLVPAVGVLASRLLTSFASAAFRSPALGIFWLVIAVDLCLAAVLVAILLPLKVGRVRLAIATTGGNDEGG